MVVLIYFFKLTVCSAIFYGYYRFFLQNRRFHIYNRFYLLGATILSLILPMLNISLKHLLGSENFHSGSFLLLFNNWEHAIIITPDRASSYSNTVLQTLVYVGYFAITMSFLMRLIQSLWHIRKISHCYPNKKLGDIKFYETDEQDAPFSFFNLLFWNNELDIESSGGQQVFRHELYHVHQKHSIDILLLEIISIVFWLNPVFHLIKKEMKAIHEFLADRNAIAGNDRYDYAELLVLRSFNSKYPQIINPFFHNQIKRRIAMITRIQNQRNNYLSRIMMLPLLFFLFLAFACTREQVSAPIKTITGKKFFAAQNLTKIFTKVDVESEYPGGAGSWQSYLRQNLHYPDDAVNKEIQGDVLMQFVVGKEGDVSQVQVISGPQELREESIRVIKQSGKWTPAIKNGKQVDAYKLQPIKYRLELQ